MILVCMDPIAGFIASLIILIYGFTHLPSIDYILAIHPDYNSAEYGQNAISLSFGENILFKVIKNDFYRARPVRATHE